MKPQPVEQVAKVRQIGPTTFEVRSRTKPSEYHTVELKAHEDQAECSCKRWQCVGWPRIRDTHTLPPRLRCHHHRASLELYSRIKLAHEPKHE